MYKVKSSTILFSVTRCRNHAAQKRDFDPLRESLTQTPTATPRPTCRERVPPAVRRLARRWEPHEARAPQGSGERPRHLLAVTAARRFVGGSSESEHVDLADELCPDRVRLCGRRRVAPLAVAPRRLEAAFGAERDILDAAPLRLPRRDHALHNRRAARAGAAFPHHLLALRLEARALAAVPLPDAARVVLVVVAVQVDHSLRLLRVVVDVRRHGTEAPKQLRVLAHEAKKRLRVEVAKVVHHA
mmetsp:Transcript_72981/g.219144  ORF Transcript_72981/g.219144 Transcript_72981/m.219144 type:complete len:244 (-) Transcript_72981:606-1337(-)